VTLRTAASWSLLGRTLTVIWSVLLAMIVILSSRMMGCMVLGMVMPSPDSQGKVPLLDSQGRVPSLPHS